ALIDLAAEKVVETQTVRQSWFGLALAPEGNRLWWSGGGAGMLHTFDFQGGKLTRTGTAEPILTKADLAKVKSFKSGLALDLRRQVLYSLDINEGTITAISLKDGSVGKPASCGSRPYDVALARSGTLLYVSDWAARTVLAVSPDDFRIMAK